MPAGPTPKVIALVRIAFRYSFWQRLRADGPPFHRDRDKIFGQLLDPLLCPIVRQADAVAHGLIFQRRVVLDEEKHAFHSAVRGRNIGGFARKAELRAPADRRDGKLLFQKADVPVTVAKNGSRDLHTIQFDILFCHVLLPKRPSLMLLLYHQNIN